MAKKTLLAVDDSLVAHRILEEMLKGSDYEIVGSALDGVQAVKLFEELRPDVVLLDIIMPQQDGLETLKQILNHDLGAKVIMASSYGTEEAVDEALSIGARGFVQKPYDPELLMKLLDKNT